MAQKPAKKKPGNGEFNAFVAEGNRAIGEQRFSDAIHAYKDALKIKPRAGKVYKFLGIAYASTGNAAGACENYRKYISLVPDAPDRAQVEDLIAACK
ncbi:MAG TPA: tetratricopeptide repeat protein [bacterium]|nr:tetratricopeptide repeat protein [bacterium]